jgi:uncharacterized protein YggE
MPRVAIEAARGILVTMQPWGIAAHGSAIVTAKPELAKVRFRISRLEQTPAAAFAGATEIVTRVRETLRQHRIRRSDIKESRLDLRALWHYGEPTQTLAGYQCQAAIAVETSDLDGVPQLLVDVIAAGASEIDPVDFDVRDRAGLQAEAERRAVEAARARAARYAKAAGVRLGAVLHVEDGPGADQPHAYDLAAVRKAGPGEDLAPGEITVTATVRVGFAITRE